MEKIKTIIVDDEKKARDGLISLLKDDTSIDIVMVCEHGLEAIEYMTDNEVHIAFMDIQMPGIDGFDVLNSIPELRRPLTIFVTAFDKYALKAFEYHALDYLLKPFTDQRFYEALAVAKKNVLYNNLEEHNAKLERLLKEVGTTNGSTDATHNLVSTEDTYDERLVIKTSGKKIVFVYLKDIEWIEAFDYYIKIHTTSETHLVRESLKRMESKLPEGDFMRIHRSSIVNAAFIKEVGIIENSEYQLKMKSGEVLKVSRTNRPKIQEFIRNVDKERD